MDTGNVYVNNFLLCQWVIQKRQLFKVYTSYINWFGVSVMVCERWANKFLHPATLSYSEWCDTYPYWTKSTNISRELYLRWHKNITRQSHVNRSRLPKRHVSITWQNLTVFPCNALPSLRDRWHIEAYIRVYTQGFRNGGTGRCLITIGVHDKEKIILKAWSITGNARTCDKIVCAYLCVLFFLFFQL